MGSIIKSVSLDFNEDAFLKDFLLSPTQLLKEKIWEMKGMIAKTMQQRFDKQANVITFQAERIEMLENVLEKNKISFE